MSEYRRFSIDERLECLKRVKKWVGPLKDVNTAELANYILWQDLKIKRLERELNDLRKS